jgi:citronellol/citronellal dehydrogenase
MRDETDIGLVDTHAEGDRCHHHHVLRLDEIGLVSAARAGVENMTKTLAIEWALHNIQVNAIAPGIIRTSGTDQYPPELIEMSRKKTPMKRLGNAGEVAELIVYLASDAASFVTGECWYIDGGAHLWGDNWIIPDDEPPPVPAIIAELGK